MLPSGRNPASCSGVRVGHSGLPAGGVIKELAQFRDKGRILQGSLWQRNLRAPILTEQVESTRSLVNLYQESPGEEGLNPVGRDRSDATRLNLLADISL